MMKWRSFFNFRSSNPWIIALGVAANLFWSFFVLIIAFFFLDVKSVPVALIQVVLLICEFLGPFLIGWFCGWLAFDDRGAMYGLVGALGSVLIILITLLASGAIAILLSLVALAGGFNGGALTRYRRKSKQN